MFNLPSITKSEVQFHPPLTPLQQGPHDDRSL
jgi:hypothetical protein